jgi:hypothetical protein
MRHLVLAAALLAATGFALTPAKAEFNGPIHVNNQCVQHAGNNHEGLFYYWGACPKQAAAPVEPTTTRVVRHARRHHG